jgi:CRISPR-associated protein Csh2
VNRFSENVIYSEQIMSPFRNPGEKSNDSTMTTLGTQSKLQEGHYVHHFSVNPKNIADDAKRVGSIGLTQDDISKLKEGLQKGVSYYDSAAKSGTENELLLWVQLKPESKAVLPSFVELVDINAQKEIDLHKIKELLSKPHISSEIEKIELYYNDITTKVINAPENAVKKEI